MKSKLLSLLVVLTIGLIYWTCTHDDGDITPSGPKITRGTNIHLAGTTAGNPDLWKFDKSHSSVLWQTKYVGAAGLLTGRFNQFGLAEVTDDKAGKSGIIDHPSLEQADQVSPV